jgi:hypothetical protein
MINTANKKVLAYFVDTMNDRDLKAFNERKNYLLTHKIPFEVFDEYVETMPNSKEYVRMQILFAN